jgi:hypothetical protein
MEDLNGVRDNFKKSKKLNRRFHSPPFRKLQAYIEYKVLPEGIEVRYLTKGDRRKACPKRWKLPTLVVSSSPLCFSTNSLRISVLSFISRSFVFRLRQANHHSRPYTVPSL